MKKFWPVVILLLGLLALVVFFALKKFPTSAEKSLTQVSSAPPTAGNSALPANQFGRTGTLPASNSPSPAGEQPVESTASVTNIPPLVVLQNARRAIVQYAQVFGSNPVGTNPEITDALTGGNPKHVNFIPPDAGLRVNDRGEMLDAWGTPLFFHQLSGHEMEIHSAGEDKKMWTFDDLVTK
jgi:type II secretory pathway pseudopilin PulG